MLNITFQAFSTGHGLGKGHAYDCGDGELPSKWQMAKAEKNVLSEAASLDTKILVESFRYKNNHIIQIQ